MSDGGCQAKVETERTNTVLENNEAVIRTVPGTSTSASVFLTPKKELIFEPCKLPQKFVEKLKDTKNPREMHNSSKTEEKLLERKQEIIITKTKTIDIPVSTTDVPKELPTSGSPKDVVRFNIYKNRNRPAGLYAYHPIAINNDSSKTIGGGRIVYETTDEQKDTQEDEEEYDKRTKITAVPSVKLKKMGRNNKIENNVDEFDSVSAETKNELNDYLEHGTKSIKILNLIEIINQNKKAYKAVEHNNKPNININIFKMIKPMKGLKTYEKDSGEVSKQSKIDNNESKFEEGASSDLIEKGNQFHNDKYHLEIETNSDETFKNRINEPNSAKRIMEFKNNNHLDNTNNKIIELNMNASDSSEKKDNYKAETKRIRLLETNLHSESDSIENRKSDNVYRIKNNESNEIKQNNNHESDSSENLSDETPNNLINKIIEMEKTAQSVETKSKKSKHKTTKHKEDKHKKEENNPVIDSDESIGIKSEPTHENYNYFKRTLRPKKNKKKDFEYIQGSHILRDKYVSYEKRPRHRRRKH